MTVPSSSAPPLPGPPLPDPPRRDAPITAPVAVVFAAVAIALGASLDARLASAAAAAPPAAVALGRFVTEFGSSGYMFAYSALIGVAAVVALGQGRPSWPSTSPGAPPGASPRAVAERALYFFAAVAASGIADQLLKHLIGRARPHFPGADGPFHFEPLSVPDGLASFPSGHTTSAFAAAVALGFLWPDRRAWLLGAAALIGASRVLVGAHHPSDVVAGAALGAACAAVLARLFARRGIAFTLAGGRAVVRPSRPAGRRPTS